MWSLLTALVTGGIGAFRQERQNKAEEIKQKGLLKQAEITAKRERVTAGDNSAAKLDEISMSQRGWKDEYLLLITTAPLVLCFIPDMAHFVELGFKALALVPEYYWYGLAMVYIDTFGFRRMLRVAVERYLEKRLGGVNG